MFIRFNSSFSGMTILYGDTPTPTLVSDVFEFFFASTMQFAADILVFGV
jgi:hypothetical protein